MMKKEIWTLNQTFDQDVESLNIDFALPDNNPKAPTEFDIRCMDDIRFIKTVEHILPQIYVSLQYQLRDPKLPNDVRKETQQKVKKIEDVFSHGIDIVWKASDRRVYEGLVKKYEAERKQKKYEEMKKEMVSKLD